MIKELTLLKIIHDAAYEAFAYRLGPDEWEKAEALFRNELEAGLKRMASNKIDRVDG